MFPRSANGGEDRKLDAVLVLFRFTKRRYRWLAPGTDGSGRSVESLSVGANVGARPPLAKADGNLSIHLETGGEAPVAPHGDDPPQT
jgi:hypothetical protein